MEQLNIFKKAHTKQSDLKMGRRSLSVFKRFYLFIFRERGRDGEREGEKHQYGCLSQPLLGTLPATQACALMGN